MTRRSGGRLRITDKAISWSAEKVPGIALLLACLGLDIPTNLFDDIEDEAITQAETEKLVTGMINTPQYLPAKFSRIIAIISAAFARGI